MQPVFSVGQEPIPGYRLMQEGESSAFYKLWKVQAPDGSTRLWKVIDMVVGNAAVETRTLGLLVQLRHPNLNTLTNFWQLDDGRMLVIETDVPTMTLQERLRQCQQDGHPGVPPEELHDYLDQAAEGLDFLNSPVHQFQGQQVAIYHRALRPECLLLFQERDRVVCKVSDFGLAKPVSEQNSQHSQGLAHYDYDPPEFFEGETARTSDQYALAIVYYELRTGKLPFGGSMLEQLQSRLNDSPNLHDIPEPDRSVVRMALSRDPNKRFPSCKDFAQQIKMGVLPPGVTPPPAPTPVPPARTRAPLTMTPPPGRPAYNPASSDHRISPNAPQATPPPISRPAAAASGSGVVYRPPPGQEAASEEGYPAQSLPSPSLRSPANATPRQGVAVDAVVASLRGGRGGRGGRASGAQQTPEAARRAADNYGRQGGPQRIPVVWGVVLLVAIGVAAYVVASSMFTSKAPVPTPPAETTPAATP